MADGSVFIAHSMAPAFVLHLIENGIKPFHCFFVSGFYGNIGNDEIDGLNKSFMEKLDWEKVSSATGYTCYYSDNDPYVPLKMLESFADRIHAEKIMVAGAGHFNTKSGYTRFPQLLESIIASL